MKIIILGTVASSIVGFRSNLIKDLASRQHKIYAFALDYDESTKGDAMALGAIPIDYSFSRGGINPFMDLINTWRLSKLIKGIEPDVVFSYFSKPVIFGTLAAVLAGCHRCIGMLEGLGYSFTVTPNGLGKKALVLQKIQVFLYRIAFPYLEHLIFLNPDDSKDLLKRYKLKVKRVSVLGGIGVDMTLYPYKKPRVTPVNFIFIGRLLAEKGIHDYVAAARFVKLKYPESNFFVLGDLDSENPGALSCKEIDALTREGLIIYPGQVINVQDWLADSSVFVLPSYREGVPRSTQEAMAMGLPVITTDVPGCRETVINGVNGWLVPPFSPESLTEKMYWFIENQNQIEVMGMASHELARERFDVNKVNQVLIDLLESVEVFHD